MKLSPNQLASIAKLASSEFEREDDRWTYLNVKLVDGAPDDRPALVEVSTPIFEDNFRYWTVAPDGRVERLS